MHILVFSPTPTHPADQGNRQRVQAMCKALRERGAIIHFAYFPREWGGRFSAQEHAAMAAEWDFFDTIIPSKPFVYQTNEYHFGIDDWWDDAIGRFIQYKTAGMHFAACIVNYSFFSKVFDYLPSSTLKILDTHDRLSGRRELLEKNGVGPEFFYTSEEEERRALNRADVLIAINPEEASFFRQCSSKPVLTIGHVVEGRVTSIRRPFDRRFGFLGSSNSVNVKNVNDFLSHLSRESKQDLGAARLEVVGSCSSKVVVPRGCPIEVRLHGRVDNVQDFYSNVDCVIIPFRFGTGQKIKMIEALSYGLPIISTKEGSGGSATDHPAHCATSFESLVHFMQQFCDSPAFRDEMQLATKSALASYQAWVKSGVDSLVALIGGATEKVRVDSAVVQRLYDNFDAQERFDHAVTSIGLLDALGWHGTLDGKKKAVEIISSAGDSAVHDEPVRTLTGVEYVFADFEEATSSEALLRVEFSSVPRAPGTLRVAVKDQSGKSEGAFFFSCPVPPHTVRSAYNRQIIVMCEDVTDSRLWAQLDLMVSRCGLFTDKSVEMFAFDKCGIGAEPSASKTGGFRVIESGGGNPLERLTRARASALSHPSIGILYGASVLTAGAFHRVLINDCGPVLSWTTELGRFVDGEVMVRSAFECANYVVRLLNSPSLGVELTRRKLSSLSGIQSAELLRNQIQRAARGVRKAQLDAVITEQLGWETNPAQMMLARGQEARRLL